MAGISQELLIANRWTHTERRTTVNGKLDGLSTLIRSPHGESILNGGASAELDRHLCRGVFVDSSCFRP